MSLAIELKACSTSEVTTIRSIAATGERPSQVWMQVQAGTVYLGGTTAVCSTAGLTLTTAHARPTEFELWQGDTLYAIASSSGVLVECLSRY